MSDLCNFHMFKAPVEPAMGAKDAFISYTTIIINIIVDWSH